MEPRFDAERLAALLDRRLNERERAEVLEQLASSDEDISIFADAVAVARELEEAEGGAVVVPLRRTPRTARWGGRWTALAALLAALALSPWIWSRVRGGDAGAPARAVALLERGGAGLPAGWDDRPWSSTRGAGDPLAPPARAARLGALMVDLEVAVEERDPAAQRLAAAIAAMLEEVPGAGQAVFIFHQVEKRAGEAPEALEPLLAQGWEAAERLPESGVLALGAWAEAGRIAALRRQTGFFRNPESAAALDRAAALPGLSAPARAAVERLRSGTGPDAAPDWAALERDFAELLRALGS